MGIVQYFRFPLAEAASWNPDLVEQASSIAANEATANGMN